MGQCQSERTIMTSVLSLLSVFAGPRESWLLLITFTVK